MESTKLRRVCNKCGNTGRPANGSDYCVTCGRHYVSRQRTVSPKFETAKVEIPPMFADFEISDLGKLESMVNMHKPENYNFYERYRAVLTRLHSTITKKGVPTKSLFIQAPPNHYKTEYGYALIKAAQESGLSTAPLFDTNQIQEIVNTSISNQKAYGMRLEEILYADVLVVKIPDIEPKPGIDEIDQKLLTILKSELTPKRLRSLDSQLQEFKYYATYNTLCYLLDARHRLKRATIFISTRYLSTITGAQYKNTNPGLELVTFQAR